MTRETASAMAKSSLTTALEPRNYAPDKISSILVKVNRGTDIRQVSAEINKNVPGVRPIERPNIFSTYRSQILGLLWAFFAFMIVFWVLAMLLIGLIFSMVANERRHELAVLRAIGATRNFILRSIISEAFILALAGVLCGIIASFSLLYLFQSFISTSLKMTFLFPSISSILLFSGSGVVIALVTISLAALIPALHFSRKELAIAMRE